MEIFELTTDADFCVKNIEKEDCCGVCKPLTCGAIVLTNRGTGSLKIKGQSYDLAIGSVLFIYPCEQVDALNVDTDFNATVLLASIGLLGEAISRFEHYILETFFKNRWIPSVSSESGKKFFLNIIENLKFVQQNDSSFYKYEQALCLLRSLFCYAADRIKELTKRDDLPSFNRLEEHFRTFMQLLTSDFKRSREVAYYAEKMHLTPKYLNYITNSVAQRTCKNMIDNYVTLQIKSELRSTQKTIQEIAYEYNFANQSFLGSYFKKFTDMSPRKFRTGM
ncbi:MAG: helix-turn-helix domain-containing protein [Muribaculaceae bacterium]|nr:helix-turn-helix domain-containing protein [Muribaculaceae bacterium]